MKNKLQVAFTLIEMLVVLGIIAIVITIASVSYSTAQKKNPVIRDVKVT